MYINNAASFGFTHLLQVIKVVDHTKGLSPTFTAALLIYFAVVVHYSTVSKYSKIFLINNFVL